MRTIVIAAESKEDRDMLTPRNKVWWFALSSRLFLLAASAVFNLLLPDHSADAFVSPHGMKDQEDSFGDILVRLLFGGLVRWDAQYFIHIALYGYTFENCLAFFPLLPLVVRILAATISYGLAEFLSQYSICVLSAVIVNVICFVKSAVVLYDLSLQVLKDARLSYVAAVLYSINPASIFFSAPYSETLFALLSFYGMFACSKGLIANCGILFGLAATTRSNGILGVGFIIHSEVKRIISVVVPSLLNETRELNIRHLLMFPMLVVVVLVNLFPSIIATILALMPFVSFQAYGYYKFCVPHPHNLPAFLITYADAHRLILPGLNMSHSGVNTDTHWCNAWLPLSYSYVQSHYWDVGFLKYYQWKQIPNFLLALPVIVIIFLYARKFLKCNLTSCVTLGFVNPKSSEGKGVNPLYSSGTFVYVAHAVALTAFSILFINIQVTTRLISSASPVMYWFVASMFCEPCALNDSDTFHSLKGSITRRSQSSSARGTFEFLDDMYSFWKSRVISQIPEQTEAKVAQLYFLSYFLLGTAMFSNFYPWT